MNLSFMSPRFLIALAFVLFTSHAASAMDTQAQEAIVVDDTTDTVLFEKSADQRMPPSSMSKLLTVYIAFSRLKEGSLKLSDTLPVSEKAWRTQGSKTFVEIGGRLSVDDLLQGIIVQSGNDACVVIAEGLAGSEESFAEQMNSVAKKLGMTQSHFTNATGLPDDNHYMTARDLAILSHHIIHDFPEYYHYFSQKEFVHHGITQGNRNLLLYKDNGVDGLKTGHTDAGGFGICATAKNKSNRRVLVVVNGLGSEKERAEEAERLLDFGFRDFEDVTLLHAGSAAAKADVWFGAQPQVGLTTDTDLILALPKAGRDKLKVTLVYDSPVRAPVSKGDHIADLRIEMPGAFSKTVPLTAAESVDELHGIKHMMRSLTYRITGQ
jgi:serine-type D-Ala-D-Ala carboxypeptidase (penicillin-binding protein 5/6)